MRLGSVIFLVLLSTASHAQYENILHKSFAEKIPALVEFYGNTLKIYDTSFRGKAAIIEGLRSFGEKHQDEALVVEASLAAAWLKAIESPNGQMDTRAMLDFIKKREQAKDHVSTARAWRMLGDMYWHKNMDYETALDCFFKNIEIGKDLPEELYPEKMNDYSSLGNIYYHFKEYRQAMVYMKQALTYRPPYKYAIMQSNIRNTLGMYYQITGNLDSSDYYFNEILRNETARHEEWCGIAMGNLGQNCFLRGEYAKAIPLLEQDIAIAIKYHAPQTANLSIMRLANVYLKQNDIAKATALASQAKKNISENNGPVDEYELLYPLLGKLAAASGNTVLSQLYLDSTLWAKDSVAKKFNALKLARAEQKAERETRRLQVAALENEKKNKTFQRNLLIGLLIFLTTIGFYIYRLIQRRHKQEQLVKDLQLEKKETELSTAQQQLKDFTANFHEKARLLEELETQLQSKGTEEAQLLEQLQQTTLLTDEQWTSFRQVFDKVHGGYLIRLKEKLPDLTPAEIRYMALAKLKFSNKEMASALGISQQTVRVTVHRLRKKLNLPEEGSLAELVESI